MSSELIDKEPGNNEEIYLKRLVPLKFFTESMYPDLIITSEINLMRAQIRVPTKNLKTFIRLFNDHNLEIEMRT